MQTLFTRWLRAHKDWWDKGAKNVPQQIGAALKDESFYTQAFSTGSAVVKFSGLPVAKPAGATLVTAMLAGQTQDATPDAADQIYVAAIVNRRVYVVNGSIAPPSVAACDTIRAEFEKKTTEAYERIPQQQRNEAAYDRMSNQRRRGEAAFKRCFAERAPKQPAFVEAVKQAQALLATALGK